ncbi:MAG: membrane protein insertase YidC [Micrococcales bacterium]|nr:membrane protein insertase YidC [Micrococcales bacterium]
MTFSALPAALPTISNPVTGPISSALAAAYDLLTRLGLEPDSGTTWVAALVLLVVGVRLLVLPIAVHGVRTAHASARARPQLTELSQRYKGRTDIESMRAMAEERRAITSEHGVSPLGCLPMLLQLPVFFGLYRVLSEVAQHRPIGAMTPDLVASLDSARFGGVAIADRFTDALAAGPGAAALMGGLVLAAATLTWASQRFFTLKSSPRPEMPQVEGAPPMPDIMAMMPALSFVGVLAGGVAVPFGIVVYWLATNVIALVQAAVIWRWAPTPGSEAHAAREARRAAHAGSSEGSGA